MEQKEANQVECVCGFTHPPPWLPTAQSQLDWLAASLTTGAAPERIADAVAEAVTTKLARYQKLELDAQFIADAVLKRIEEERQIQRLASEIIRKGVEQKDAKDDHAEADIQVEEEVQ